ncbi:MAG: CoA transferase [Hyphomicrobiaceae bacterium]|nr:CoA transferase [Hyphomicrobiaceae bacterium]
MAETPLAAHLPLAGLKVIEISTSVAAPFAAWILATLGADVIKVERKGSGDDARQWGKIFPDGSSSTYHALNRDKRGVTVDLKDPADRAWLEELCVGADIVLQNMRPGTVDRYGLGAQHLRRLNPKLIYCNLWAFGFKGPLKDRPGYDPLMQAYGGLMSVTGEEGRPPIRVGTSIIDMGSGLWCVVGILSAINHRHHTGEGCVIDASLYETSLAWMNVHVSAVQVDGLNPKKEGSGARGMAPYQAYACSDGHLVIAAPNDSLFKRLSEVLGHPEWPSDPRFDTNQKRARNLPALNALIEPIVAEHPRQHWQQKLDAVGIPSAPVQNTSEMMADPQTLALGILQRLATGGPRLMGMPLSFNGERPPLRRLAPTLGQHNEDIKGRKA